MIGVTVRTPKYAALSEQAVARFKRYTGLKVKVIECDDSQAFQTKLEIDRQAPRTRCIHFDADWWALRQLDVAGWTGSTWLAVHDAGVFHPGAFCKADSEALGLEKSLYFNSGFFAWDNANAQHRRAFRQARTLAFDIERGAVAPLHDFGEQSLLNAGVQQAGVPLSMLPFGYNCMLHFVRGGVFPYVPRVVHAVHAAGVPLRGKMPHLRSAAAILGYEPEPMQPEALAYHHALSFETR